MPRRRKEGLEREQQILTYVKQFLYDNGYPPSVREIGSAVGLKSSASVHAYLHRMEDEGLIKRNPAKPRAISINEDKPWTRNVSVPYLENPLDPDSAEATYSMPENTAGDFMMQVTGSGLPSAGIYTGDLIVVARRTTAEDGAVVVAPDGEGGTVVKRYDGGEIIGRVAGMYRRVGK